MNPNSKIWRAGQEIKLGAKVGEGLQFSIDTEFAKVTGVVHPDGRVFPNLIAMVKVPSVGWETVSANETQRPLIGSLEQMVAIVRSWTGDWIRRASRARITTQEEVTENEID